LPLLHDGCIDDQIIVEIRVTRVTEPVVVRVILTSIGDQSAVVAGVVNCVAVGIDRPSDSAKNQDANNAGRGAPWQNKI